VAELDAGSAAKVSIATTRDADGAPIVTLSGELDSSNVAVVSDTIAAISAERPARLVFDLGQLRFMDSAGIAILVGVAGELGTVAVRNPTPIVRRLIEVTGLAAVLRIEP
jgi:anti-anti-sigma factor